MMAGLPLAGLATVVRHLISLSYKALMTRRSAAEGGDPITVRAIAAVYRRSKGNAPLRKYLKAFLSVQVGSDSLDDDIFAEN
jgi:hypothetical protein